MMYKEFLSYVFCGISLTLFIRASIIPLFAVFGDPGDEMFMSVISLAFVGAAFVLSIKKDSHIVGPIMIVIGGYYIWNGYRLLMMISENLDQIPEISGLVNVNIYTIYLGSILIGLGSLLIIRKFKNKNRALMPRP